MKKEEMKKSWRGESEEIISGMTEWREQHPTATMSEIEAEIDQRLAELRVKMITDMALASKSTEWAKGEQAGKCPVCGHELEKKGKKKRVMQTRGGKRSSWSGNMGSARGVGPRFFPLDEELALVPGMLTPLGHEQLVRLAGWMPFERAAELFEDFTRIGVSSALSRRYTEKAGEIYVELQTKEMEQLEREKPPAPCGADKLQVSADGAMVPLLHGEWGEARTLVIGEVQPAVEEKGKQVVHTRKLSYFSRKVPAQEFERLALVEMHRRGVENAREVAAIQDGAEWEQGFVDYHCPKAVRILDFPHAGEHINQVGQFLYGEGTPQARQWLEEHLHRLKENGPAELLAELCALEQQHPQAEPVSGNLTYLQKRQAQMQYPLFQAQGWPIGSGIVESGNKLVVEARLKGSGMHWADKHVDPMLAIRNILCSDRWKMEWPKIANRLQHPHPLPTNPTAVISTPFDRPAPPLPKSLRPPQQPNPDGHPPKDNPWRRFSYGRLRFRPKDLPKN